MAVPPVFTPEGTAQSDPRLQEPGRVLPMSLWKMSPVETRQSLPVESGLWSDPRCSAQLSVHRASWCLKSLRYETHLGCLQNPSVFAEPADECKNKELWIPVCWLLLPLCSQSGLSFTHGGPPSSQSPLVLPLPLAILPVLGHQL